MTHALHARLLGIVAPACLVLAACGGDSNGTSPTAPTGPDTATRTAAANTTAQSSSNACSGIGSYYWEIGDKTQRLASGAVGSTYGANTAMNIASASKWLYGAYVVERRGGMLSAEDIRFLNFQSGYANFSTGGCDQTDSVASCLTHDNNGDYVPARLNRFYYDGGHMQTHANASTGMNIGPLANAALATEIRSHLGIGISLSYTQPQLAGGARSTPADYATYLRKLLNNQLQMAALLGSHPVCTNPLTCSTADYTPTPSTLSWHYSLGHWVEDDPATGDGAFSSPGAFGFYPWVDSGKTYYGIVARQVIGGYRESAACGALIRKAWLTGTAQ